MASVLGAYSQYRDGRVLVGPPHLERETLELAAAGDDVVHDLGHDARVDQVPLDPHVLEGSVLHGILPQSDSSRV